MLVKSHENEELRRKRAGDNNEPEADKRKEMAALEDYRYWAHRKEESIANDKGCISDDDESHTSAKTDPASDPLALRPDARDVFSTSPAPGASRLALQCSLRPDATSHSPDV